MLTPCRQQILSGIPACEREFAHQAFGVKGKLYFKFPAAAQTFAQPPYLAALIGKASLDCILPMRSLYALSHQSTLTKSVTSSVL